MPIVTITKTTKHTGSRGILSEIARRLSVSRNAISRANRDPKYSARLTAVLVEYQRTGRLPNENKEATN